MMNFVANEECRRSLFMHYKGFDQTQPPAHFVRAFFAPFFSALGTGFGPAPHL